jgi:hypothetical protein
MAAAGVPMRTLQEWPGHRNITTTLMTTPTAARGQAAPAESDGGPDDADIRLDRLLAVAVMVPSGRMVPGRPPARFGSS